MPLALRMVVAALVRYVEKHPDELEQIISHLVDWMLKTLEKRVS